MHVLESRPLSSLRSIHQELSELIHLHHTEMRLFRQGKELVSGVDVDHQHQNRVSGRRNIESHLESRCDKWMGTT